MANQPYCLVLGGSGYVGSAVVRALVSAGAQVCFTWNTHEQAARHLASQTGATALRWEARDDPSMLIRDTPIHALVQCIGTAGDESVISQTNSLQKFLSINAQDWQHMHDVTVSSTFNACQTLVPHMAKTSNVVVVGSMDGVKTVPAPVHYAAGKAALAGLVRSLAKALGGQGICVNMIAAGILEGGVGAMLNDHLRAQYLKHCSLKRLGRADEVAAMVTWLVMRNTYVTGQSILLDGGL